jgi:hypothetical protein
MDFTFDGNFKTSIVTWSELSHCLFRCTAENGFHLAANGTQTPYTRYLYCTRFRKCKRRADQTIPSPSDYRQLHIKSDRGTAPVAVPMEKMVHVVQAPAESHRSVGSMPRLTRHWLVWIHPAFSSLVDVARNDITSIPS